MDWVIDPIGHSRRMPPWTLIRRLQMSVHSCAILAGPGLPTDSVSANDKAFSTTVPYLAATP